MVSSYRRCCCISPVRLTKQDVDLKTPQVFLSFSLSPSTLVFLSVTMGNYSSALIPDTDEFDSIVSLAEKLNEQVAHAADERLQSELQSLVTLTMEVERKENQSEELDSSSTTSFQQENSEEPSQNGSALPAAKSKSALTQSSPSSAAPSFSSLLPKALSAVLHATLPPRYSSVPRPIRNPPNLEQLQTELRELRANFEQMKSQHNKEIKLLMNELDEEKRIRLTLQMEVQRMKKHMSK
ncbi:SH3 domain-containing kinase-binding protein 1 isoform X2 [Thunnus albacares]|uniref:SH3 domain-containing kinase-binding protein 1 isoform X2 n=1 Tax=Thunnus albacares TaxID=8236 RepID=UPI001CF69CC4|nr:SH3 domain-containing kinase-binding protein 1 isoform X2 [Thunnus albacares]